MGSMRRTFVSIANCSNPNLGRRPSEAHRRLGELQVIRAGIVAGLTEWKNRKNSGMVDAVAQSLADVTISHFTSQLGAVDEAIAQTIDNDFVLRRKRDLLLSISGVGETLAGVVLAELPGPNVLHSSAEVVAYVGLNPRQYQSGTSIDRVHVSPRATPWERCDAGVGRKNWLFLVPIWSVLRCSDGHRDSEGC